MRLWLAPHERKPNPAPATVDDRRAFLVGTVAWVIAVIVLLLLGPQLPPEWLWSAVAGVVLGLLGLGYSQIKRPRA
ncbi:MAG TPA: DUF2530 domain-containing protein [Rhodoglobus sp.]|nr:DUF2530 domain-containing protein [Rhodoglobus sp.]